jgi:actin-related protein
MSRGIVKDWDLMSKYCDVLLGELGISDSDGASIMLVENPLATTASRAKWAEIMFESSYYQAPALCFGNSSSMCLFSSGRTTGVAVELGAGITSSVPVFEGLALKHAAITVDKGGQDVTARLRKLMSDRGIKINFEDTRILKENMTYVDTSSISINNSRTEKTSISLPDGNEVEIENKLFSDCNNVFFQYNLQSNYPTGLGHQVGESLSLCDDFLRRELSSHIIIAGGCSMTPGIGDRLAAELNDRLSGNSNINSSSNAASPSPIATGAAKTIGGGLTSQFRNNLTGTIFDIRVFPSTTHRESGYTNQRRFAPWIGGSIFGSLETFNDLKLTRQEWEESGDRLLLTKCY